MAYHEMKRRKLRMEFPFSFNSGSLQVVQSLGGHHNVLLAMSLLCFLNYAAEVVLLCRLWFWRLCLMDKSWDLQHPVPWLCRICCVRCHSQGTSSPPASGLFPSIWSLGRNVKFLYSSSPWLLSPSTTCYAVWDIRVNPTNKLQDLT